ncbi:MULTISPECIES: hypothetical protein [Paraburkholderia]|uniref:hypothetical protein n=1 Tax=Paraburkholderia TaxID=1822464 RepID=UPI00037A68CB|nr:MULTISPECIES: hypothetical protein [Paraburkholderia]MBC8729911.1 hypothetical protein [Paraburkholderia sp. UCT2]MDH6152398.1 hypothetical protein [Paraburkholderia sp. WSM4179]
MRAADNSLHSLVDKWLGLGLANPVRVMRFGHTPANRRRYALVQTRRPTGMLSMFFFRHDNGEWCVFPPTEASPAMRFAALCMPQSCDCNG